MKRLTYILIPAVLAFGLVFGVIASGAHDLAFGKMHMLSGPATCEGALCGFLPELTCDVHCLTSGLHQSLDYPVSGIVSVFFLVLVAAVATAIVILPSRQIRMPISCGRPPPADEILKVVKRE